MWYDLYVAGIVRIHKKTGVCSCEPYDVTMTLNINKILARPRCIQNNANSNTMMEDNNHENNKQCFSPIQSRRLWSPMVVSTGCRLCPSMDLVALTLSNKLFLHRTMSWQKLATLEYNNNEKEPSSNTHVAWSPDGRIMAVALPNGNLELHHIESIMSPGNTAATVSLTSELSVVGDAAASSSSGLVHKIEGMDRIVGLCWSHVGKPHPCWQLSDSELEQAETWRFRSRYLDRANVFLPPSSYHQPQQGESSSLEADDTTATAPSSSLPSCKTPLSLLCVATATKGIHLYLHGRYHIATLKSPETAVSSSSQNMVCSHDLTHALQKGQQRVVLYHLPALRKQRHFYQIVASLYCSITMHLQSIQTCGRETLASLRAALHPLDAKLANLVQLLKNYGITDNLAKVLYPYILVGHVKDQKDASPAMDQFFTSIQMNDQLIQRLERSLHGAVANVESQARRGLLAPAQALVYHVGELYSETAADAEDLDDAMSMDLVCAFERLLISIHACMALLVEFRFRVRDFVSWLRCVASQIKAKGTAPDSALRTNAKKRRVPQVVVERMTRYLKESQTNKTTSSTSITETLLGVPLSDFFSENVNTVQSQHPSSPKSVEESWMTDETKQPPCTKTPTIVFAANQVADLVKEVFEQPRHSLTESVTRTDFWLSGAGESVDVGIHTRIGIDNQEEADHQENMTGFFCPRLVNGSNQSYSFCRHWAIVAKTELWMGNASVQLLCLPLGRYDGVQDDDDSSTFGETTTMEFYLASRLVLPSRCRVKEIAFYGDDGKSSLSSGSDSGTGQEGRQAMALLVDRRNDTAVSEELWVLRYDDLVFEPVLIENDQLRANGSSDSRLLLGDAPNCAMARIHPTQDDNDDEMQDDEIVYAKTRRLSSFEVGTAESSEATTRLMMSGSRGIGGVFTIVNSTHNTLDLFDLEEDDEEESDDDEQ